MKNTKIAIRKFCEEYNKRATQLQESYIKENLVIVDYVPFIKKNVLAQKLVDITTYVYEDYIKDDGDLGRRKTDKIQVDSVTEYLLFCRLVIENYTNLTVETEGFFEEYDALKKCGLLDKLMVGTETVAPLIPANEMAELRSLVSMKKDDALFNKSEIHNYIDSLIERFGDIIDVLAKPIMDKAIEQIEEKDDNNGIKDITDFIEVTE